MEEPKYFVIDRITGECFIAFDEVEIDSYRGRKEYVVVAVKTLHYWNTEGKHSAEYI